MSDSTRPTDADRIADLLVEWEELFEQGQDVSAAALCRDRPDLAPALAARIDLLRTIGWVRADPQATARPDGLEPPAEPLAGRYRLDAVVGEGGFGRVWRGFDLQLQRTVAVKVPRVDRVPRPDGGEDAVLAEARKVARLAHPGIVPVFDVGRHGGTTFIVSELVDGDDLGRRMREDPVPLRDGVRIVLEAARHLDYAHRQGFVHRDVKPANILVGQNGRVFVSDFGIAVAAGTAGLNGGSGTPAYMAPERFDNPAAGSDPRADVYGLGVVLYELLTGRVPFRADTPAAYQAAVLSLDPAPPRALNPEVPPDLERACLRCLAKDPEARPASAAALAADLADWLDRGARGGLVGRVRKWFRGEGPPAAVKAAETLVGRTTAESWVGRCVVFKHRPAHLCGPGNDGRDGASGQFDCHAFEVWADTGDWIEVALQATRARVHKTDVVPVKDAALYFTRLIRREANNPDHFLRRSVGFRAEGQAEAALADCNAAMRVAPPSARALVVRAWSWYALDEASKAIKDLAEALRLQPTAAWTWAARGMMWRQLGDLQKAEEDLSQAVLFDPLCALHCVERAHARWELGKTAEAVADLESAVRADPASPWVRLVRGEARLQLDQLEGAVEDISECVRAYPAYDTAWKIRGDAFAKMRRFDEALADYTEALRLDPKNTAGILGRAIVAANATKPSVGSGSVKDAIKACEQSRWKDSTALVTLAVALADRGDYQEAMKWLGDALEMHAYAAQYMPQTLILLGIYKDRWHKQQGG